MPRAALALALLILATAAAAMDTPLTLVNGSRAMIVDPVFGSISVYQVSASDANRLGLGRPASNFINDLDRLLKTPVAAGDGDPVPHLRLGTLNAKPAHAEFFQARNPYLAAEPTAREKAAGRASALHRAFKGEDAFWKGKLAYDGVVRAATTGTHLALAIPALHTLLVYQLDSDAATLFGAANWGPALYIPAGVQTGPDPAAVFNRLPPDRKREAAAALGLDEPAAPAGAAPAGVAAEEPPTPKSEVWIGAAGNNSFLIVDTANAYAMLYAINGKSLQLMAVRNLLADLKLPTFAGGALASEPFGEPMLKQYLQARKTLLATYKLPNDPDTIQAYVQQRQAKGGGKASEFEGAMVGSIAFLNFVKNRVFVTLDCTGGSRINMVAARDTSIDTALAQMDEEINSRIEAQKLLDSLSPRTPPKSLLLVLRYVFSLDPNLWKDADQKLKSAFKGEAKAEYQALIDEAKAKAEELAKAAEDLRKAVEERRKTKPR